MKLQHYLRVENLSAAKFGRMADVCSRATMCRYVNGDRIPPPEVMRRIFVLTAGAVDPNSFYDLPDLAAEQAA